VTLINGARLAREVRLLMIEDGLSLDGLLRQEKDWYDTHVEPTTPERILDDSQLGAPLVSLEFESELKLAVP
jgi:hypothetical protein